jgi:SAM-dependent methyltransferase
MALSDGQKVLLQLAVAVHPTRDEKGVVLVMDEPENHLHPAALIMILDRIQAAMANAQIWIATHSVPLIAHLYELEPDCLHFVASGRITYAGRTPERVLNGLLGSAAEQEKLLRLLDLPHTLAASRFAASCLRAPAVSEHAQRDSQNEQIRTVIAGLPRKEGPIRILDFGAGKARLLAGLTEECADPAQNVDYVAFEPEGDNRGSCERQLVAAYGSSDRRLYGTVDELFASRAEETFDVVVMCNVLHEIAPSDWPGILGQRGPVYRALKPSGYLLLVEDLRIPVGELPGPQGFFLLDTVHLLKLFLVSRQDEIDTIRVSDARDDGRLKAHLIPKTFVGRITSESIKGSIQALRETSVRELQQLRTRGDASSAAGHLHGLWSQQFANCSFFLGIW